MAYARRAAAGFSVILILALAITALSLYGMGVVLGHEARARENTLVLARAERMRFFFAQKVASGRAFLLSGEQRFLDARRADSTRFDSAATALTASVLTDESRELISQIVRGKARHDSAFADAVAARGTSRQQPVTVFLDRVAPIREEIERSFMGLEAHKRELADSNDAAARDASKRWTLVIGITSVLLLGVGMVMAIVVTRSIRRREETEQKLSAEVIRQSREMEQRFVELRTENERLKAAAGRPSN